MIATKNNLGICLTKKTISMELLKIKCLHCGCVSVVKTTVVMAFCGKLIKLKCGNPLCGLHLKIKVPEIS
jgi:transcription elongation factor Elf1